MNIKNQTTLDIIIVAIAFLNFFLGLFLFSYCIVLMKGSHNDDVVVISITIVTALLALSMLMSSWGLYCVKPYALTLCKYVFMGLVVFSILQIIFGNESQRFFSFSNTPFMIMSMYSALCINYLKKNRIKLIYKLEE